MFPKLRFNWPSFGSNISAVLEMIAQSLGLFGVTDFSFKIRFGFC